MFQMIVTTNEMAKAFGVTRKTVSLWVKKGLPKKQHGKFDLNLAIRWWADNIYRPDTDEVADSKEKYWAARARREVVKADEAEGRVIPAEEVETQTFNFARLVRDAILAIPDRIGPELASCTDVHTTTQKLTRELLEALEELSNTPDCIKPKK